MQVFEPIGAPSRSVGGRPLPYGISTNTKGRLNLIVVQYLDPTVDNSGVTGCTMQSVNKSSIPPKKKFETDCKCTSLVLEVSRLKQCRTSEQYVKVNYYN